MPDYFSSPRPQKDKVTIIEKTSVNNSQSVDIKQLADAISKSVLANLQVGNNLVGTHNTTLQLDQFDDSNSLEKLAKSMIVQRGKHEGNIQNIGNIAETQKDTKGIIDIISEIND